MNYWFRIGTALAASILLNVAMLTALPYMVRTNVAIARTEPAERTIRLDFSRPAPEDEQRDPKQLIDAGAAAEGPVAETDLISSRDSQAQDNSDAQGDPSKPSVDELGDFDEMPVPPSQPSEASEASEVVTPPDPAERPQETPELQHENAPPQPKPTSAPPPAALAAPVADGRTLAAAPEARPDSKPPVEDADDAQLEELTPQAKPKTEPLPERVKVAQATPPATKMPVQELKSSRGREEGGALKSGFTSFEANRHELGEYMLHVRSLVEREWRSALRIRYTGVSRTEAVIECSIRPDGSLEYARVIDPGLSLTYAVLCRQAIEQAAPFGPFPFDVPEIYRKDNLEITWKFSYL